MPRPPKVHRSADVSNLPPKAKRDAQLQAIWVKQGKRRARVKQT